MSINFNLLKNSIPTTTSSTWNCAILIIIAQNYTFFIKRSQWVSSFKNHLAFVGGKRELSEIDPWQTARREFEEETTLCANNLVHLANLPLVKTGKNAQIVPIVVESLLSPDALLKQVASNGEWSNAYLIKNDYLYSSTNWYQAGVYVAGQRSDAIHYLAIPPQNFISKLSETKFEQDNLVLWGASAKMVWSLINLIKG